MKGKAMIRKIWVPVIAGVLVSGILIEGQVFAAGKKIVVFRATSD